MNGLIVATKRFEDSELSYPYYRLQEAGYEMDLATPGGRTITGKVGYEFDADLAVEDKTATEWANEYDILVVPGGKSPEYLRETQVAVDLVREFDERGKPIATICHGPQLLISSGILPDRTLTAVPRLEVDIENAGGRFVDEQVVVDDNLVTSRTPADLPAFMREFVALLEE